ncbi:alpha/beta hydrolase [Rhizobium mesosinicum]|uniref:Alpha/beta hydrolase n=1 Tax=Rhizobium mesosinicum TaxID=335017 RepID=A0ABS7GYL7_9HYPH|nr:alpha/beta hydrolase [Rhizobium mesosinicum]
MPAFEREMAPTIPMAPLREGAARWGSGLEVVGAFGHINGQSGLEDWPEGLGLLKAFAAASIV